MRPLFLPILFLSLYCVDSLAQGQECVHQVTLVSDYDAAIGYHDGGNTADNNYGTASQLAAYALPSANQPVGLNVNRALLHFDLSSIPKDAEITSAQLDLFAYGPLGPYPGHTGSANNCFVEKVLAAWTEDNVTWNNQPPGSTLNRISVTGTTNPTLNYLNVNITAIIQDIFTSPNNYGIKLRLHAEEKTNILIFCSEDHPDSQRHPRLKVTYELCSVSIPVMMPIADNQVTCGDDPVTIFASGGETYSWYDAQTGGNLLFVGNPFVVQDLDESTAYYVSNTTANGESIRQKVMVSVYPKPELNCDFTELALLREQESYEVTVTKESPKYRYDFDFGDGTIYGTDRSTVTHTFLQEGDFMVSVIVTDSVGCRGECSSLVHVGEIFIPNIITVNEDDFNSTFTVYWKENDIYKKYLGEDQFLMHIYNRWGRTVFTTNRAVEGWTGENVAAGSYYYSITLGAIKYKGMVNVIK